MAIPKTYRAASRRKSGSSNDRLPPFDGTTLARRFWRFSLQFYRSRGVAAALLRLQDQGRLDVNLLLLCCFAASCGRRLRRRQLMAANRTIAQWNDDAIQPLRSVRRALKGQAGQAFAAPALRLRPQVARLELAAERVAQTALAHWLADFPVVVEPEDRAALALGNLTSYSELAGRKSNRGEAADLAFLAVALGSPRRR